MEWSFKRAITIQTFDGYDPIPVPFNTIYRIFKLLLVCFLRLKGTPKQGKRIKRDKVGVKAAIYLFGQESIVFQQICLSLFSLFLYSLI